MKRFIWVAAFALACSGGTGTTKVGDSGNSTGGGTGDGGGEGGGGGSATFADYINVTVAPVGDFTGFEGGYDAVGAWNEVGTPTNTDTLSLSGEVKDFESDEEVSDATVEIWHADAVSGAPDSVATSDASGAVAGLEVPNCTPVTYKVTTDAALGETKPTIEAHAVYQGAGTDSDEFNSVSTTTYQIIPSLLGVSPQPDKGIIAGTAYDVNEDQIEGAQVIVTDASGNIAGASVVKYFVDDFPNRNQEYTSADGLWVAINVPPGTWNVEMYVADGAGGHLLMGSTVVEVVADSINISNIYAGYGEGVKLPDGCFAE
jgi:hypothetical protein